MFFEIGYNVGLVLTSRAKNPKYSLCDLCVFSETYMYLVVRFWFSTFQNQVIVSTVQESPVLGV